MGLIDVLTRAAGSRAHVLVAEAPGAFRERVALERAIVRMGWCRAQSVADADVLAVVGEPGEDLAAVLDHVWSQTSEPRVRVDVRHEAGVAEVLAEARDQLVNGSAGRTVQARSGFTPSARAMAPGDYHHDHDHDHDAMMPDGIPLAEGAEDRDGLEMDELHLPLGPVLAHWPPGLVLTVTLHGDVVVAADVEQLTSLTDPRPDDPTVRAARLLDAAGAVLSLAGLPAESARVAALRDRCLDGELEGGSEVTTLGQRVARRRALRWVLGGLSIEGVHGGTETLHDRLLGLFEEACAVLEGEPIARVGPSVAALPALVGGMELATLRLWLAALAPDLAPDLAAHEAREVGLD